MRLTKQSQKKQMPKLQWIFKKPDVEEIRPNVFIGEFERIMLGAMTIDLEKSLMWGSVYNKSSPILESIEPIMPKQGFFSQLNPYNKGVFIKDPTRTMALITESVIEPCKKLLILSIDVNINKHEQRVEPISTNLIERLVSNLSTTYR